MTETSRVVLGLCGGFALACASTTSPAITDASSTGVPDSTDDGGSSSSGESAGSTTDASADESTGSPGTGADSSSSGEPSPACEADADSVCGNPASLIHGSVQLAAGMEPMTGDLVIELMHRRYGSPDNGGHPHQIWRLPNVTVGPDDAVEFDVDMCDANASMWSEENCEYNLIVILDRDSNTGLGPNNLAPDVDDPTAVEVFNLSCHAAGPTCFDLELSCMDGGACVTYEPPEACECAADSCDSEAAICQL